MLPECTFARTLRRLPFAALLCLALAPTVAGTRTTAEARDSSPSRGTTRSLAEIGRLLGQGEARRADSLASGWVSRLEQRGDTLGPDYAEALGALVDTRVALPTGRSRGARPIALHALARQEQLSGPASPHALLALARAAAMARAGSDRSAAKALTERASAIVRAGGLPSDWLTARGLFSFGSTLIGNAAYAQADSVLREGTRICSGIAVPDSLPLARALISLGIAQRYLGQFDESVTSSERGIGIEERLLGANAPEVGRALNPLAVSYRRAGHGERARPLLERSIRILESRSPVDTTGLLFSLSALGNLLQGVDPNASIDLQRRALQLVRLSSPRDTAQIARTTTALAQAYWSIGDYLTATELLREALRLEDHTFGAAHAWDLLSTALRQQGDFPAALDAVDRALAIYAGSPRSEVQVTAWCYWVKGLLHRDLGDERAAAEAFAQSFGRYRTLPPYRTYAWRAETEWADSRLALGDAAAARERAGAVLAEMGEPFAGSDLEADALRVLAGAEAASSDSAHAFAHALRAERAVEEGFRSSGWATSERFTLEYSARLQRFRELPLAMAARSHDAAVQRDAWSMVIRSRALLMDVLATRGHEESVVAADSATRRLAADLARTRREVATLALQQLTASDSASLAELRSARLERDRLDNALIVRGARPGNGDRTGPAGVAELASALPDSCALVAFVEFAAGPGGEALPTGGAASAAAPASRFIAFVLPAHGAEPLAIPLGGAIRGLASRWRAALEAGPTSTRARVLGDSLRRAAWDPVAAHLGAAPRVLLVPDGALSGVSFAALPTGRSRYLVESGPTLHYLSAERDVFGADTAASRGRGLLALGDVDFEADPASPAQGALAVMGSGVGTQRSAAADVHRAADCRVFRDTRFQPLPGSREEVLDLADAWRRGPSAGAACTMLSGARATEEEFRRCAPGSRVIHVATHAFFIDEDCAPRPALTGAPLTAGGDLPYIVRENPLLLSGLVLAGANRHANAKPGSDDGLLTSEEVASLDLSGVDWVVLSACESGLGVADRGEGILGLRRAFAVAGARTLITSLWKVPDSAARDWMQALYQARFEEHLDTAAAMRSASLQMLRRLRQRGLDPDPRLWGAFIATGDWR